MSRIVNINDALDGHVALEVERGDRLHLNAYVQQLPGATLWLGVLTELRNRGVTDACTVVCDGLKILPDAINTTRLLAIVQTCVRHPIRNTFLHPSNIRCAVGTGSVGVQLETRLEPPPCRRGDFDLTHTPVVRGGLTLR